MSLGVPEPEAILNGTGVPYVVIPAYAGIREELGPGVRRDDGNVPFGKNSREMLYPRHNAVLFMGSHHH